MRGFERTSVGYVARMDAFERDVLAQVVADVAELLGDRPSARTGGSRYGPPGGVGVDPLLAAVEPGNRPDGADAWTSLDPEAEQPRTPVDTGVRRLLPDASEDQLLAAEFRRLTEDELRRTKRDRLHALWSTLIHLPYEPGSTQLELCVDPGRADELAATLTDIRLVLADRLEIVTDEDAEALYEEMDDAESLSELDEELKRSTDGARTVELEMKTARTSLGTVYVALTWLQESLLEAMTADLDQ